MTQSTSIRIAGNNYPIPTSILNALPQWWQELAAVFSQARDEGTAYLAVPYGSDDTLMACDDEMDAPVGWWCRFRITPRTSEVLELADILTGNRYNVVVLAMFLDGLIAPDAFDSLEVLQITQEIHLAIYGCTWDDMPAFKPVA